jgi:hypothetical protein
MVRAVFHLVFITAVVAALVMLLVILIRQRTDGDSDFLNWLSGNLLLLLPMRFVAAMAVVVLYLGMAVLL